MAATQGPFIFTISDLGRFLGKSPVTIRGWERQGLIEIPREGVDRKLTPSQVRVLARWAFEAKRINEHRLYLVETAVTILTIIELQNEKD